MTDEKIVVDQGFFEESETVKAIGSIVIWVSIITAAICCYAFGKMQVDSSAAYGLSLGHYKDVPNWPAIVAFIASGLSGVLLGYLFLKVGSVLRHLEEAKLKK